ncbi:hypothetical protein FU659_13970 [Paenibacillus sp. N3.4]|nr:hypothetical protein FU659_13970 [Paenibacillus sp. N3.4]
MPSPIEGKLVKIIVGDGETAAVGEAICLIEEPGAESIQTGAADAGISNSPIAALSEDADQSMRGRYSPAVHRMAQDHQVDLARVPGTGLGGRITRKDVEQFIASGGARTVPAAVSAVTQPNQPTIASQAASVPVPATTVEAAASTMPVRSSGIHLSANPQTRLLKRRGILWIPAMSTSSM